jgi:predicted negative regulator of RcsB-dependent stress response
MAKKVSIKQLLRTDDAFLSTSEKAFAYFKRHTLKISLFIGLVLVALLVGFIIKSVQSSKLAKGLEAYHQAVQIVDTGEQNTALQAVRSSYPNSKAARQAAYSLLTNYLKTSDLEKALPLVDELIKTLDKGEESLKPLLLSTQAGLLEQNGQLDLALAKYQETISLVDKGQSDEAGEPFLAELYSSVGRTAVALGRTEEAKKAYEALILRSPGSYPSYTAQVKLSQLLEPETSPEAKADTPADKAVKTPEVPESSTQVSESTDTSQAEASSEGSESQDSQVAESQDSEGAESQGSEESESQGSEGAESQVSEGVESQDSISQ